MAKINYVATIDGVQYTDYQIQTLRKIIKGHGEFIGELKDQRHPHTGRVYEAVLHMKMVDYAPDGQLFQICNRRDLIADAAADRTKVAEKVD